LVLDSNELIRSRHIEEHGTIYFAEAIKNGLEGVVKKRIAFTYLEKGLAIS